MSYTTTPKSITFWGVLCNFKGKALDGSYQQSEAKLLTVNHGAVLAVEIKNVECFMINRGNLCDAAFAFCCLNGCITKCKQAQNALSANFGRFFVVDAGVADGAIPLCNVDCATNRGS